MKKTVLTLLVASLSTMAVADIQSPPGATDGPVKKLGRAVANIIYGSSEMIHSWRQVRKAEGTTAAASVGVLRGAEKTVIRAGYGLYELVTFPAPTYKQGYKAPYYKKASISPHLGYTEFPPQVGMISQANYTRTQSY